MESFKEGYQSRFLTVDIQTLFLLCWKAKCFTSLCIWRLLEKGHRNIVLDESCQSVFLFHTWTHLELLSFSLFATLKTRNSLKTNYKSFAYMSIKWVHKYLLSAFAPYDPFFFKVLKDILDLNKLVHSSKDVQNDTQDSRRCHRGLVVCSTQVEGGLHLSDSHWIVLISKAASEISDLGALFGWLHEGWCSQFWQFSVTWNTVTNSDRHSDYYFTYAI